MFHFARLWLHTIVYGLSGRHGRDGRHGVRDGNDEPHDEPDDDGELLSRARRAPYRSSGWKGEGEQCNMYETALQEGLRQMMLILR